MKSNDFVVKGYSRVRKFLFPVHPKSVIRDFY